jgi:hypothetical protein
MDSGDGVKVAQEPVHQAYQNLKLFLIRAGNRWLVEVLC